MKEQEHWVCKNLKLSIRQEPGAVILKLEEPLAMREIEVNYQVGQSTVLSRSYHIREAMVIGMRRLISEALEHGMLSISLSGSLGALTTSSLKEPLTNWEPREADTGSLIPPDA